ncbi:MAG: pyridoxal-dependent decarboxylase, exosortase A system-associated [Rhodocyclales bacterium]|nr:pyridoxal-dependent decarboxylase, exosortase A system-associated [Rhodocyclales bacterium]
MPTLSFPHDAQHFGGQPIAQLAAAHGTPFYAYDSQRIIQRIADLRAALPRSIGIHYAIKANPFPPLLRLMAGQVDGVDIASAGELELALQAGIVPGRISFAGPGKRDSELARALAAGVLVNAESEGELLRLAAIAQERGQAARVALRVNPAFELKGSGMRMGGGPRPFGIDEEMIPGLLAGWSRFGRHLEFAGLHIFAGSQNLSGESIAAAQHASYQLALRLAAFAPTPIKTLNLGGGFGIPYFPHESALDLAPISKALSEIAADAAQRLPHAALHLELGRYLVGEAGIYVTRIIDKKVSRGHTYLVTDGGLNHHLAASGNFGQVIRRNYPVAIIHAHDAQKVGAGNTATTECSSVVGPLCTPLDLLADKVDLPRAEPGDLCVIFQSGAYGASASPQGFLSHPAVLEVLL